MDGKYVDLGSHPHLRRVNLTGALETFSRYSGANLSFLAVSMCVFSFIMLNLIF